VTATATREKPILFADRPVRAIRDWRKTVTRRPIVAPWGWAKSRPVEVDEYGMAVVFDPMQEGHAWIPCPFTDIQTWADDGSFSPSYRTGTRLYVRECWGPRMENGKPHPVQQYVKYRADFADDSPPADGMDWHTYENKWRPSIHMPKWAARLWLEIVSVRVERIQEITSDDARAEGIEYSEWASKPLHLREERLSLHQLAFSHAWDSIYPGSWDRNDWVWRIEFRNSKGAADA
jgi:hypothetical protein